MVESAGARGWSEPDGVLPGISARARQVPWRHALNGLGMPPDSLALCVAFDNSHITRYPCDEQTAAQALLAVGGRSIALVYTGGPDLPMSRHRAPLDQLRVLATPGQSLRLQIGPTPVADTWTCHAFRVGEPVSNRLIVALAMLRGFTWPDGT